MACFITPATIAIITTVTRKKIPIKYHIEWLNFMLWGGVIMLLVDHLASGEIILYPPFLTAMQSTTEIIIALKEMATTGVAMTLAILIAWSTMVLISNKLTKAGQGVGRLDIEKY